MCRTIIHHRMHHDVRVPMMLPDPSGSSTLNLYANPLRTVYHRCEVPVSAPATCAPSHQQQPCSYHSCCTPFTERRFCTAALEIARRNGGEIWDVEPEECERFVLEHRHHRLERLGSRMASSLVREQGSQQTAPSASSAPSAPPLSSSSSSPLSSLSPSSSYDPEVDYQRCFPSQNLDKSPDHHYHPAEGHGVRGERASGITVTTTTTWRHDLKELQWRDDHGNPSSSDIGGLAPIPGGAGGGVFAHRGQFRGPWEEQLFLAAERLYLLLGDAETHYAVLRDMTAVLPTERSVPVSIRAQDRCCWEATAQASSAAASAAVNYVRVRETLRAQRILVGRMMGWAGEPCFQC